MHIGTLLWLMRFFLHRLWKGGTIPKECGAEVMDHTPRRTVCWLGLQ